jgi:anthranilate synthase component 1
VNRDDEERHRFYVEALARNGSLPPDDFGDRVAPEKEAEPDVSDEAFKSSVEKFLSHVLAGDIFQGVLSRGLWMESAAPPLAVYRALRSRNPSPYMFYVDLGDGELLGASPETCLKVERGQVMIRPIAGTAPRGLGPDGRIDEELDARLAVSLLLDTKEQAEHAMLVDLARNDVARVSVPGTRQVTEPFCVEKYSHVQHLVSGVKGALLPGLDALHAYVASANMGTLTGAPKLRAMELIRETEPNARGYYGGAVGYLLQDGRFDSCIVIRTLRHRNGRYLTRTGAGIVADSVPERELEETIHKARACRVAISLAEGRQA